MRMLWKARYDAAVVHAPAFFACEVLAEVASGEARFGPHGLVAFGVGIVVMHAEEERVDRDPRKPERSCFEND